jgi:mono/diheme cytochrome c family protein
MAPERPVWRLACTVLLSLGASGCSSAPAAPTDSEAERGKQLFEERSGSTLYFYPFSCSTCHDASAVAAASPRKPGAPLAGVTQRPTFWGGQENDLLDSINVCERDFMGRTTHLTPDDPDAAALYAYLLSLGPGDTSAFPFTVVGPIVDVPRGNADSGQAIFTTVCSQCHGTMHDGAGRLSSGIPILPDQTVSTHPEFDAQTIRLVFIEKIRHGLFDGYGGSMAPFSSQILSDGDVSDVLEALGLIGQ